MTNDALDALRRWAMVDPNDEEEMANLRDAMLFAEGYIRGAGAEAGAGDPVYDLLLRKLTLYYFEARSADSKGVYPDPPPDLNALIIQLRTFVPRPV